jgi:hypothetical protein
MRCIFDKIKETYETQRTSMMQLESFANDLLLELLQYFDRVHLLRAFYGINSRFNTLLLKQFTMHIQTIFRLSLSTSTSLDH